ncbi:hypothetical protein TNIN_222541 [Trichonephila inaurata madagascariensis]|uniref:Uncharacterized protein n=1 Tax=Trichonephila inaurata madagascariensis TaxID=2747483 RepID=A0A8X6YGW7_9ARAC|nr:hypothetical protein TNIN_222541 [Trichonephila inaurata madagascariensis]
MDQSVWVKALHANGPSMLNVVGNVSHENPDDDTENQCMWELIQKKSHKLFQKRVPNPAEEKKLANATHHTRLVELNVSILNLIHMRIMGKVRVDDLPSSLWCPEIGKSIYDYLINSRVFYKTHLETMLQNVLGVDGNQLYSFFQEWDRKEYPFEETPANFPKLFTCAKSSAL